MKLTALIPFGLCLCISSSYGLTVLSTDFDSLATGAVTSADLDGSTLGGTWTLNTTRGAAYTIEPDPTGGGDLALLADDTNGGNANAIDFFTINLATPVDLTQNTATIDFGTATRRTGNNKALRYQLLDSGGAVFADLFWANAGTLTLNSSAQGSSQFQFTTPWNPNAAGVRDVSYTVDSSSIDLDFAGIIGAGTHAATDLAAIRILSDFNSGGNKGLFLNDVTVSIPEPGRAMLLGLGALVALMRRRR